MKRWLDIFREVSGGSTLKSVVTREWVVAVQESIKALAQGANIKLGGGMVRSVVDGGVWLDALARPVAAGGGGEAAPCPFGEITTWTEGEDTLTGIRGGVVIAGDKVWNVEDEEINLASAGEWLVWLEVGVTANTDEDAIATLPGLETSEEPTWEKGTVSGGYPDMEVPDIFLGTAEGLLIIPIGKLVITIPDGAETGTATLVAAGCGNFTGTYCPGTLGYTRGG